MSAWKLKIFQSLFFNNGGGIEIRRVISIEVADSICSNVGGGALYLFNYGIVMIMALIVVTMIVHLFLL